MMNQFTFTAILLIAAGVCFAPAAAQEPGEKEKQPKLPGLQLLDEDILRGDLDIADGVLPGEELSPAGPITSVAGDMAVIVRDLFELSTGEPTQHKQREVVKKLDVLIEQLEKQCAACRQAAGNKRNNPRQGMRDSLISGGPGGIGDLYDKRKLGEDWGKLPPKERDRILQAMTEGFPAHYQRILEKYYRRLAEGAGSDDLPSNRNTSTNTETSP